MRGAIAAGHPTTAEAGAAVLREGGNAVDACLAAAVVSWVVESPLTGPGGGGFMLVHDAESGTTTVLDFFVAVPRQREELVEMVEVAVDFDGDTQQIFHTGPAAVAVPGTAWGLREAHRRWGTVPWPELVAPAAAIAREGFELNAMQTYLHDILDPLLRHTPEGKAMYTRRDGRLSFPDFAATLERIGTEGADWMIEPICAHVPLTREDFDSYEVIEREPARVELGGCELRTVGDWFEEVGVGGTTHISVVDARGDAASLSSSLGSGSGVVVPGTGIHLNNALGEAALVANARPGERLTSQMAPSIVLQDGRPRLVVGSAGSERLRGAIKQVVLNVVEKGMGVRDAVDAPRVHLDGATLHAEPGAEAKGENVVRWREKNLFFGGVSAVEVRRGGSLAAAGDPRRGGAGVVVE